MSSVLFEAAAGAGKTQLLVNRALEESGSRTNNVAITTFTDENTEIIRRRVIKQRGYVPSNVEILPWYTFLLRHGARPFQYSAGFGEFDIKGIDLVNGQSTSFVAKNTWNWFFNPSVKVYSDKLSALALLCDRNANGAMTTRLRSLFSTVYIDEIQDMAGYDFDFIETLMKSGVRLVMAGDQRQQTYKTNLSRKNKTYNNGGMTGYITNKHLQSICKVDTRTLSGSYRCCQEILDLANCMYPHMTQTYSIAELDNDRLRGVFLITEDKMQSYIEEVRPHLLRYKENSKGLFIQRAMNIGIAKGSTYEDVCIYPTAAFKSWILNHDSELAPATRSLFYVALTRARYSVAIVVDQSFLCKQHGLQVWDR